MPSARIHIGTSGWHYPHWVGPFYPPGTRPEEFLGHYARVFQTVKINNIFYRLPSPEILPTDLRYSFEFRDESWFTRRVYRLLARATSPSASTTSSAAAHPPS